MKFLLAIVVALILNPFLTAFMFAMLEKVRIPAKVKVVIIYFGHYLIIGLWLWLCLVQPYKDVTTTYIAAALFIAVGLCRAVFSSVRFLTGLQQSGDDILIRYLTPYAKARTVKVSKSEILDYKLSPGKTFWSKPAFLRFTIREGELKFYLMDPANLKAVEQAALNHCLTAS